MSADFTWVKNDDGSYSGVSGGEVVAKLRKVGKRWSLEHAGQTHDLGPRATFDSAERRLTSGRQE
jgi:hypothetical protein